jgi:hypothetical protein
MAMKDSSADRPHTAADTKKPYEKPAFRYEQVFVTTALSCGKMVGSTQGTCGVNPNAS